MTEYTIISYFIENYLKGFQEYVVNDY